jgi:hypothetical protein
MPLVWMSCAPGWRLPDGPFVWTPGIDPRLLGVHTMAVRLTTAISAAVNEVDAGPEVLVPTQVLVRFTELHGASLNAPQVQILIMPGAGDPNASRTRQRRRRARIHDLVHGELEQLFVSPAADGCEFPAFDIEVLSVSMSGTSSTGDGQVVARWGGAAADRDLYVVPTILSDEELDMTR